MHRMASKRPRNSNSQKQKRARTDPQPEKACRHPAVVLCSCARLPCDMFVIQAQVFPAWQIQDKIDEALLQGCILDILRSRKPGTTC